MIKTYLLPHHALETGVGNKNYQGVVLNVFTYLFMLGSNMLFPVLMVLQLFNFSWLLEVIACILNDFRIIFLLGLPSKIQWYTQ